MSNKPKFGGCSVTYFHITFFLVCVTKWKLLAFGVLIGQVLAKINKVKYYGYFFFKERYLPVKVYVKEHRDSFFINLDLKKHLSTKVIMQIALLLW